VNYIHKYYTDPRTKKPHPFTRIETAFPLIKYNVDIWEPVEKQATAVVKKFIEIQLPMSKTEVEATIKRLKKF
jgi:ribosome maturation protein Sdo1